MPRSQFGFSLVEISIVLVIVALLTAVVFGGQSLIESAKVSNLVATTKDLSIAFKSFREKYHYLPGDLPNAASLIPNTPAACDLPTSTGSIGDGAIDTATESGCAVEELFQAGLVRAEIDPTTNLHVIKIETGPVRLVSSATSAVAGFPAGTNVAELTNLRCAQVQSLDGKIDDGDINNGKAKASVASCSPGGANDPVPTYAIALN